MYSHRRKFIANLLFFSTLLQSCGSPSWKLCEVDGLELDTKKPHHETSGAAPLVRHALAQHATQHVAVPDLTTPTPGYKASVPARMVSVEYGPFKLPFEKKVTFNQVQGRWKADVRDVFAREETLPVVCKGDIAAVLSDLQGARPVDVSSRIHIMKSDKVLGCVYVGALGVRGGGKQKKKNAKKGNGSKVNQKQKQDQTTTVPSEAMSASEYFNATRISPQLSSMIARAKDPANAVFKALEEYRKYCTDNGFDPSTTDVLSNYNATISDINNHSLDQVWDLCEKGVKENIDAILLTLLNARSSYLERRTKNIEEWLSLKPDKYPPIPTCDYLFRILYQGKDPSKVDQLKTSQECIRRRFQLINSVIVHLFHAKLAQEGEDVLFAETTKQLLESAKYLHPLLAGGDFVGDPDDFATNLSGVSSLLQAISPDPDPIDPISIVNSILSIQKARDWMEAYGAKHSKNNNGCYDYDSKFPLLTTLQWYKKDVTKKRRDEQLAQIKEHMTPHDMIRTIVSLYKEKVLQDKFNQYFEADLLVDTSGVPWLSTFLEAFRQYQQPQEFVEGGSFFEYQESVTDDEQGSTTADQEATPSDVDEREVAHLALKKTSDERTSHLQPIDAHGRTESFVTTQGSSLPLTNTTQKTWDKLFDTNDKISCRVTYACYISLWKVLGGKMGNKVGSHRMLLDREDHFAGTIVKLHGEKDPRYGPKTIKKLREMVIELTIRHNMKTVNQRN